MPELIDFVVLGFLLILLGSVSYNIYISVRKDKNFIGTPPINKCVFIIGKVLGFSIWGAVIIQLIGIDLKMLEGNILSDFISAAFFMLSTIFMVSSFISLRESSSLGLPQEQTSLKTSGIYKISRNPMYVAFYLSFFGAIFYTLNLIVMIFTLISILIYHKIILSEERYLEQQFGEIYLQYKKRVRRYL